MLALTKDSQSRPPSSSLALPALRAPRSTPSFLSLHSAPHNFLVPLCSLAFTTVGFQNIPQVRVTSSLHLHGRGEQCCQFLSSQKPLQRDRLMSSLGPSLYHSVALKPAREAWWGQGHSRTRTRWGPPTAAQWKNFCLHWDLRRSPCCTVTNVNPVTCNDGNTGVKPWEEPKSLRHICLPTDLEGS